MENQKGNHPYLDTLKAMWDLPDETLNDVLWENTNDVTRHDSIGFANEYLDFMESVEGTTIPSEAWEYWCIANNIQHEIDSNPYIKFDCLSEENLLKVLKK
jgi:hypothetical protein